MIIDIEQTESRGINLFEILIDGEIKYYAETPWMNVGRPFKLENYNKCKLLSSDKKICFETQYKILDNLKECLVPSDRILKHSVYEVLDENKQNCGRFYDMTKIGPKFNPVIEFKDEVYIGKDVRSGTRRGITIYKNDKHVAQIIKNEIVIKNLDKYRIYLLDEYKELAPLLSFLVIYFDYIEYRNSGEMTVAKVEVAYNFSKDLDKQYGWMRKNFGEKVVEDYDKPYKSKERTIGIISKILCGVIIAVFIFIMYILM